MDKSDGSHRSSPSGSAGGRSPSPTPRTGSGGAAEEEEEEEALRRLHPAAATEATASPPSRHSQQQPPHCFPPVRSKSGHIVDWVTVAQQHERERKQQQRQQLLMQQPKDSGGGGGGRKPGDKEYSYVKFPPRPPPAHEYSYPKLTSATAGESASPPTAARRDSISSIKKGLATLSMGGDGGGDGGALSPLLPSKEDLLEEKASSSVRSPPSSGRSGSISPPPPPAEKMRRLLAGAVGGGGRHVSAGDPIMGVGPFSGPPSASGSRAGSGGGGGGSGSGSASAGWATGGGGGKQTCVHCRESFSASLNARGSCDDAPDCARSCVEAATCLSCAKCLLYHCMSDSEGDYVHPCECSNADGHWMRRWTGLALLSVLVPCLCCYAPLIGCYRCGALCGVCGGKHKAAAASAAAAAATS